MSTPSNTSSSAESASTNPMVPSSFSQPQSQSQSQSAASDASDKQTAAPSSTDIEMTDVDRSDVSAPSSAHAVPHASSASSSSAASASAAGSVSASCGTAVSSIPSDVQAAFESIWATGQRQRLEAATSAEETNAACRALSSPPPALTAHSLHELFDPLLALAASTSDVRSSALLNQSRLLVRLASSQRDLDSFHSFLQSELQPSLAQSLSHLRASYLDPGLCSALQSWSQRCTQLREEVRQLKSIRLGDSFQADSIMGRKLLVRVQKVNEENEELGKQIKKMQQQIMHMTMQLNMQQQAGVNGNVNVNGAAVTNIDEKSLGSMYASFSSAQRDLAIERATNVELTEMVAEHTAWLDELESAQSKAEERERQMQQRIKNLEEQLAAAQAAAVALAGQKAEQQRSAIDKK